MSKLWAHVLNYTPALSYFTGTVYYNVKFSQCRNLGRNKNVDIKISARFWNNLHQHKIYWKPK
jgi:hypothetical protein